MTQHSLKEGALINGDIMDSRVRLGFTSRFYA